MATAGGTRPPAVCLLASEATLYEKRALNYRAMVFPATIMIWLAC